MKKLLIFFTLVMLLTSCGIDYTSHSFSFHNLSSDTLELRYKTARMENLNDTIIEPHISIPLTGYEEHGEEGRLSIEAILDLFEVFECTKGTDTFHLDNTTISNWLIYGYGGVDSGFEKHSYGIEITDEDLE